MIFNDDTFYNSLPSVESLLLNNKVELTFKRSRSRTSCNAADSRSMVTNCFCDILRNCLEFIHH